MNNAEVLRSEQLPEKSLPQPTVAQGNSVVRVSSHLQGFVHAVNSVNEYAKEVANYAATHTNASACDAGSESKLG